MIACPGLQRHVYACCISLVMQKAAADQKVFSDLQQLFISFLLFSSYSLKLQNPLVPASAKLQGQILLRFHELSVHQHIHIGQHLVCHLCMDNAAGCQIPIPEIAAVAPDILLRIRLASAAAMLSPLGASSPS